jgi:hypothetical protein
VLSERPRHTFSSLRNILAPPRPVTTTGSFAPSDRMAPLVTLSTPVAVANDASGRTRRRRTHGGIMLTSWAYGIVGLVLFVGLNLVIGNYFSNRLYYGAKVGSVAVGGWTFDQLHSRLPSVLPKPAITALVGSRKYPIDTSLLGSASYPELEKNLKDVGRSTSLPLMGLITAMFSAPVLPNYELSDMAVSEVSSRLGALVYRQASNAAVLIVGSNVVVLADKPGAALDPAATASALKASYGHVGAMTLEPVRVSAAVSALSYANEVTTAQALIGLSIQVVLGKSTYTPTPAQIGGWLAFSGPGNGASVIPNAVAAYVATIPGSFDRVGTINGIVAELNAHRGGVVAPSIARPTPNPNAAITPITPVITYSYCVDAPDMAAGDLADQAASTLGNAAGWSLGGRVRFTRATADCNFVLSVASVQAMRALDPACAVQTACRIHNDLAIASTSWSKTPLGWVGNLSSYRTELVNHVVGQWLGFDHPACNAVATKTPVLTEPSVTIAGCSAQWYAVPPELQDTKVLGGF